MKRNLKILTGAILLFTLAVQTAVAAPYTGKLTFPLQSNQTNAVLGDYYVMSTLENIQWGCLPNRDTPAILTVPSGSAVTFDTVSHEGLLEDQGRDPVKYFGQYGISADMVLDDAKQIAASDNQHDFLADGPHVVTGPIAVEGAEPGDVLKVEKLDAEVGAEVSFNVLMVSDGNGVKVGNDVKSAKVTAKVEAQDKYRKIIVFKYKAKKNERKKQGHRQPFTAVKIEKISI